MHARTLKMLLHGSFLLRVSHTNGDWPMTVQRPCEGYMDRRSPHRNRAITGRRTSQFSRAVRRVYISIISTTLIIQLSTCHFCIYVLLTNESRLYMIVSPMYRKRMQTVRRRSKKTGATRCRAVPFPATAGASKLPAWSPLKSDVF